MIPDSIVSFVRASARTIEAAGYSVGILGVFEVHQRLVPAEQRKALLDRYRRAWLDQVLRLFNVEVTVASGTLPDATGALLVVANHRSIVDIAVLLRLFGGHIVSRSDIANWPIVGSLARTSGTIFVDRAVSSSRSAALQAIRQCLSEGTTVVIFPEGTTFEGDEVRLFRPGAFAAAKDLGAQIVTVGLAYEPGSEFGNESFIAHLGRIASRPATRVAICIGATKRATSDAMTTAQECRLAVQALVDRARETLEARGNWGSA